MSWADGNILDCPDHHRVTTPFSEWRAATAQALVREIDDFLHPTDTIDCTGHRWHPVEFSHGLAVAECLHCRALLVEPVA